MPYLKEIATLINIELQGSTLADKRFDKGAFYSIARLLKVNDESENTIPTIVDNNGVCTPLVVNDTKSFILYHRVIDIKYDKLEANGDDQLIQETATMRAVAYGSRRILKIEPELLIAAIQAGFMQELDTTNKNTYKLQKCNISITGINLNNEEVYSQEYSGNVAYKLKPNDIMSSIEYTIVSEYDRSCIDIC